MAITIEMETIAGMVESELLKGHLSEQNFQLPFLYLRFVEHHEPTEESLLMQ